MPVLHHRCLVHDPRKRPKAGELLHEVFLTVNSKPITDERAQIIDEAMESGSLQQRNVVGLITGLMGSGNSYHSPAPFIWPGTSWPLYQHRCR